MKNCKKRKREWYSVKCIFEHHHLAANPGETTYEERVVILRADGFDDAIQQGEAEAQEYVTGLGDEAVSYAGFISAYHLFEKKLSSKAEVYSLMRRTTKERDEFITHYYDDGNERTQTWEAAPDGSGNRESDTS